MEYTATFLKTFFIGLVLTGIIVAIGIASAQAVFVQVTQIAEPLPIAP